MARGARKRTWVKMFCDGCLHGSINYQLELAEQAVFYKLVMYSAVCGGEAGIISDNDGRPLPHWFISNELHAPLDILESTLKKCIKEGRISENDTGIVITNWTYYQSEYERQKQYREGTKQREQSPEQKQDQEYIQEVALRFRKKKKELGRDLTTPEGQAVKDEVAGEIYGDAK